MVQVLLFLEYLVTEMASKSFVTGLVIWYTVEFLLLFAAFSFNNAYPNIVSIHIYVTEKYLYTFIAFMH